MKKFGKVGFTLEKQKSPVLGYGPQKNAEGKNQDNEWQKHHIAPKSIRFMKRCTLSLLLLVIACTFSSCYSTYQVSCADDYAKRFKGSTKNGIIREWGVPDRVVDIGNGESVIVYEKYYSNTTTYSQSQTKYETTSYSNGERTYGESNSSTSEDRYYTEFYMNKNGLCYMVKTTDTKTSSDKEFDATKTKGLIVVLGGIVLPLLIAIIGAGLP